MAGYQRTGFTFSGLPPPKSNDPNDSTVNPKQELETYTAEFIDVLASLHSLASASNTVSCKTTQPRRHSLFKPGTPLHRLLSTPPSMRRGIPGFRIQVIARFVALLYINLTFWDLRDDVMASEGFLKTLALRIVEYDLDTSSSSIEMLVHLLILGFEDDGSIDGSDFNNLHHIVPMVEAERPWKIGRLLKVAKRLSRSSWDKLNEILLRMLAQADFGAGFTGIAGGTKSWLGGLETEILEAEDEALVAPAIE
ncbi:MAG: hypothetical protein M1834_005447 [Cirrosporium novae-zelandiae]|nr:MAG: hypothetical protein M1834_005447 [Cirrosporium novae-zelandiae]